ncbi:MAG: hypothetical protein U0441_08355 [Polyangiaceae bacterium]
MTVQNPHEDMWPSAEELNAEPKDRPPLIILREQAARLGEKTKNVVEGKVDVWALPGTSTLRIVLSLVAPALEGYEYVLLQADQPADSYPVRLEFEGDKWVANDEAGFKQYLTTLFSSARTRKIINNLIVQSSAK